MQDKSASSENQEEINESSGWQLIETAPHETWLLLAEPPVTQGEKWNLKVGKASWGDRAGTRGWAGYATHWQSLPAPPSESVEGRLAPDAPEASHETKEEK